MKRCHDVRLQVLHLLRGEIAPELHPTLERHLAACPPAPATPRGCARPGSAFPLPPTWPRPPPCGRPSSPTHAAGHATKRPLVDPLRGEQLPGTRVSGGDRHPRRRDPSAPAWPHDAGRPPGGRGDQPLPRRCARRRARGGPARRSAAPGPRPLHRRIGLLGGYTLLTLASPIPETVHVCRGAVLRSETLTMGQLRLTYLVVAALHAGIPVAVGAYVRSANATWWRTGVLEGALITILAAPILVLRSGLTDWVLTGTVLRGLLLGAVGGGLLGSGARAWREPRKSGSVAPR